METKSPIIPLHNRPTELYQVVADIAARDAIPTNVRFEGRECITLNNNFKYRLIGGIANSNWVLVNNGTSGGASASDSFTITSTDISNGYVNLTHIPLVNSEIVFFDGLEEDISVFYMVASNTITFIDVNDIYIGAKITVKYSY